MEGGETLKLTSYFVLGVMRIRLELVEALAKKHEEQITEIVERFGQNRDCDREGGPILEGIGSSGGHLEDTNRREKWRKLEIPIFAGEDLFGWTHRLERYFLLKDVIEDEKMQATVMALEGKDLSWYQWWVGEVQSKSKLGEVQTCCCEEISTFHDSKSV